MNSSVQLANRLKQFVSISNHQTVSEFKINQLIKQYQLATNNILSFEQQDLLYNLLNKPVSILNIGIGTNNLYQTVIDIYKTFYPKAAVTIVKSSSINSLLEDSCFNIENDLIVVTQSHLIDAPLASKFFNKISLNTKVLLVGDMDQVTCNSINLLKSLVVAGIPSVTQQALDIKASSLVINAHRIKHGHSITCTDDFQFIDTIDSDIPTVIRNLTDKLISEGISNDDIIIYAPINDILFTKVTVMSSSSAPVVIVILAEKHIDIMTRNYLYTVLTKAEKKVILVGSYKALDAARFNNRETAFDLQLIESLKDNVRILRRNNLLTV